MKRILLISGFFLLICNIIYAEVFEHAIAVDSSGSMAGFYNTGSIRMLVVNLQKILGGAKIYLFNDRGLELVKKTDSLSSINRDTRIDLAIKGFIDNSVPRPSAIWLVTDNVQDRTETPYIDANTKEFYSILQQGIFERIYIIPCFLDFSGKIYLNREGRQYWQNYTGRKGLIIYGILLDERLRKQFDDIANRFTSTLTGYESKILLSKPLDKDTFDLKPAETPAGEEPANIRLTEKGIFYGKGFKEGKKFQIRFYIKLLSKFDDLIVAGKVKASVIDDHFKSVGFRDTFVKCDINPQKVNIAPGKTSEEIYKVMINLDKVKMKIDPVSIIKAALSGKPGRIDGRIKIEVQVPREGFRFTDEILRHYNTDDINDYKRIYSMGSLINYMSVDVTSIPIYYDMVLAINYPYWPLVVVILIAIAFIGIIFILYYLFSSIKHEKFAISVGGEERIISFSSPLSSYNISSEGRSYGTMKKIAKGKISIKANKGFIIDNTLKKKRLNRDMDSFTISEQDGSNSIDVHIRSLRKDYKTEKGGSDLNDGFLLM